MITIFTGPTLAPDEVTAVLPARVLPPVAQGDLARAVLDRPRIIGIIDGYFDRVPAVWHKEILWAMSEGVHVFGAASMGALRAAELHTFGMVGVGQIFEAFRDGHLTDDDEVAVAHGPAETGYRAIAEAMVDVRVTLKRARAEGLLTDAQADRLVAIAKGRFYPHRSYPEILEQAEQEGMPADTARALLRWLREGRVSMKRRDAAELLSVIRAFAETDPPPLQVGYTLAQTTMWSRARMHAELSWRQDDARAEAVADELRLLGPRIWREHRDGALARVLMMDEARRRGQGDTPAALIHSIRHAHRHRLLAELPDHLAAQGALDEVLRRVEDKRARLESAGLSDPSPAMAGVSEGELMSWYFEDVLGMPIPGSVHAWISDLHLDGQGQFIQLLLREHLYRRLLADTPQEESP